MVEKDIMEKVVLDQFGEPLGFVKVARDVKEIEIFRQKSIDGTPVNRQTRKLSYNKKYWKQLENRGRYEIFTPYEWRGGMFYVY